MSLGPFNLNPLPLGLLSLLPLLSSIPWPLQSQCLVSEIAESLGLFKINPLLLGFLNPLPILSSIPWLLQAQSLVFGIAQSLTPFELNLLTPFELNPWFWDYSILWPLLSSISWVWDCSIPQTLHAQSHGFGVAQSFTLLDLNPLAPFGSILCLWGC